MIPLPGSAAARDQYMAGAFARFLASRLLSARPDPGPIIAPSPANARERARLFQRQRRNHRRMKKLMAILNSTRELLADAPWAGA